MSTTSRPAASTSLSSGNLAGQQAPGERSYFEQQRDLILKDIGVSFEHVLANINKLNRSLEGVIAVGNEFSSVEALWSQFEGVMAKDGDAGGGVEKEGGRDDGAAAEDGDGGDGRAEEGRRMGEAGDGDGDGFDAEEEEDARLDEGMRL